MFTLHAEKRGPWALALFIIFAAGLPTLAQDIRRGSDIGRGSTQTVRSPRAAVGRSRFGVVLVTEKRAPVVTAPNMSKTANEQFKLANGFFEQKKFDEAIKAYTRAIAANSKFADAHYGLGLAYKASPDLEKAISSWEKALKYDPTIYQAHAELANAYMAEDRYDDAVKEYTALIASKPNYVEAYFGLGTVLFQLTKYEEAIPNFEKAIQLNNNRFPEAYFNLAMIYLARDQSSPEEELANQTKAEGAARKAIEQFGPDSSDSADMWFLLGTVLYKKNDNMGAIDAFKKTLALCGGCPNDDIARIQYNLSLAYEVMGMNEDAINSIEEVLKRAQRLVDTKALRERLDMLRQRIEKEKTRATPASAPSQP
jgi:tetratricopeptide (TPR) repeat protein